MDRDSHADASADPNHHAPRPRLPFVDVTPLRGSYAAAQRSRLIGGHSVKRLVPATSYWLRLWLVLVLLTGLCLLLLWLPRLPFMLRLTAGILLVTTVAGMAMCLYMVRRVVFDLNAKVVRTKHRFGPTAGEIALQSVAAIQWIQAEAATSRAAM